MTTRIFDNKFDALSAFTEAGIMHNLHDLVPTGTKSVRYPTEGKPHGKDGAILIYDDCLGGSYQNYRNGEGIINFQIRKQYTDQEKREFAKQKAARENTKESGYKKAANKAKWMWEEIAIPVNEDFPYLKKKGIKSFTAKLLPEYKNISARLIIPGVSVISGEIQTYQTISSDENHQKLFLSGAKKTGSYCYIGKIENNLLLLCEGYATGCSIHEASGHAVAVCFDAKNLITCAAAFRQKHPDITLLIFGDDDLDNEQRTASNPGKQAAIEAAKVSRGHVAFPYFGTDRKDGVSDFNDLHMLIGLVDFSQYIGKVIRDLTHGG